MNYDFYAVRSDAVKVLEFIFAETDLCLYDLYSDYGKQVGKYSSLVQVLDWFQRTEDRSALYFQLWASRHGGTPRIKKFNIDPKRCDGHTFRFSTEGWGMIQLYFNFPNKRGLSPSHIGHLEEPGAFARAGADDYNEVATWNWPEIRRSSRKLQYHIQKKLSISKIHSRHILPGALGQFENGVARLHV